LLLSTSDSFTVQIEESYYSDRLKTKLYGRYFDNIKKMFEAFKKILEKTQVSKIKARSYPRLKQKIVNMI